LSDDEARRLQQRARATDSKPWSLLLLLIAATSIGPTSLNILVPALPQLARLLESDAATLQLTVSLFLVGLAAAQLVMGPLSDRFGRRPVLLAGMGLTAAVSLLAIVVATVESLIAARILQAVGASTGIVVSRAIIRDLFERDRAASILGLVATVMVAVPTLGPLIGGILDTVFDWRAIFLFTVVTSFGVLVWVALALPETRHLNAQPGAPPSFRRDLGELAATRMFWAYVLAGAFGSSTFFVFLGGGPHVVVSLMGRSSAEFGVWFAVSSAGYMAGNFAASRLAVRTGANRLIWWGIGFEATGVALALLLAFGVPEGGPAILFVPQAIVAFGNGLMLPGAIAGAVSVRPQAAGTAAGIMGCTQMGFGAACVQFSGMLLASASSAVPMSLMMVVLVSAMALAFGVLGPRR
jgi:DHA1 family bicyclomycin/chloramphenicol resistance-like MFS transporter